MGDWSDKLDYGQREYYGHFYDPDREEETEEETEEMTNVEILKEMAFTATETQRRALEDAISALSENKCFEGMTNGEVLQALFDGLVIHDNPPKQKYTIPMTYDFWNAPYQKGGE